MLLSSTPQVPRGCHNVSSSGPLAESFWIMLPARPRVHAFFVAQEAEGGAWFGHRGPLAERVDLGERTVRRALADLGTTAFVEGFRTSGKAGKGSYEVPTLRGVLPPGGSWPHANPDRAPRGWRT
jgi:hypothetical protein